MLFDSHPVAAPLCSNKFITVVTRLVPKYHTPLLYLEALRSLAWRGWNDNIKMDLNEIGCEGVDWIEVAQTMVQ
jgi:hypothetical protein